MPTIDETIAFIKQAHTGETTRSGEPYWQHPVRVMERLPETSSVDVKHAALLHDVLEKTSATETTLTTRGYSNSVVAIVKRLSRPKDEPYRDWIDRLAVTADPITIAIKLADLDDHLDPREIAKTPLTKRPDYSKYERARGVLRGASVGETRSAKRGRSVRNAVIVGIAFGIVAFTVLYLLLFAQLGLEQP